MNYELFYLVLAVWAAILTHEATKLVVVKLTRRGSKPRVCGRCGRTLDNPRDSS